MIQILGICHNYFDADARSRGFSLMIKRFDYAKTIQSRTASIRAFLRLGRLLFLGGGFVMYGLGVSVAYYQYLKIDWGVWLWGQAIVTLTQLMVHYANDYFDLEADRANQTPTPWSGGSRILTDGHLHPQTALTTAYVLGGAGLVLAFGLALYGHMSALPVILLAMALSWAYSASPFKLHARGFGEIVATLVVAVMTPLLGYHLQSGKLTPLPLLAVIPLCCLQFNMLVSVDVPDADGDALSGKRTLTVRLGRESMSRVYLLMLFMAYALLPLLVYFGLPSTVAVNFGLGLPFAALLGWYVRRDGWTKASRWGKIAFYSLALLTASGLLQIIAFISLTFGSL
jgi:1,4-dihydroxy-2-naphthoate polyprenyltransferase